jgi:predicted thioesterase
MASILTTAHSGLAAVSLRFLLLNRSSGLTGGEAGIARRVLVRHIANNSVGTAVVPKSSGVVGNRFRSRGVIFAGQLD